MKILIADDSKPAVRILKNLLIQLKIDEVEVATNGKEVLHLLEGMEPLPDVILLDIVMPIMDGIKTLKKIRSQPDYKTIKIILISSEGNERIILDTVHHGADGFIVKPIKPRALESKLIQLFPKGLFSPSIITD